jgi:predicted TPR repeat methyltransferase
MTQVDQPTQTTAVQPDPQNPEAGGGPGQVTIEQAMQMVVSLLRRGENLPQAEAILDAVLTDDPQHADALHFRGLLRYRQGRGDEAVQSIQAALEISPGYADAWNNLGNIQRALRRFPEATEAFAKAVETAPNLAEGHLNYAAMLRRSNRLPEAAASFRRAVELNPMLSLAHLHLGTALYLMGLHDEARQAYANWLQIEPDNPIAKHMGAANGAGAVPSRASDEFIRVSFDNMAAAFDEKMASLNYCAPELLADAIAKRLKPDGALDVLDAGCGTGLCGPILLPYARHLCGVDLSLPMIECATQRNLYHQLVAGELTEFLFSHPQAYDLIVSGDTLIYFGSLDQVMQAVSSALRPEGVFAFTLERLDQPEDRDFYLNPHGRYSHRESYVRQVLQDAGLTICDFRYDPLRLEMGQPVAGFIVTAQKTSPVMEVVTQ